MVPSGHATDSAGQALDLQTLIDSAPALIHTGLPDGNLDFFNQSWLNYVGLRLEDLQGWKWTASIHPDDVAGMVEKWRECVASGEPFEYETRVRRADGEYRWMFHHKVPLRDERGNIVRWYGTSIDIEDRKRAEDALRLSEGYMAQAQRLTRVGSWIYKLPDHPEYWSPVSFEIFGLDPSQGPPKNIAAFMAHVHPEDRERILRETEQILAEGQVYNYKYRIIRPDGEIRALSEVGTPVYEKGVVTSYIGAWMDVTEQERMAQEQRRREGYLAEAQRLSRTGSFGWSVASGEIFWSDETFRIFEFDRTTRPTLALIDHRIHPDDLALVKHKIERASQDAKGFDLEHRLLMPDGSIKYVHVVANAMPGEFGQIEFVGAVMDITAAKQAEEKIRKNEEDLKTIIETIPVFVGTARPDGTVDFVSQSWLDYTGLSREEWLDWGWMKATHPEDLDRSVEKWRAALAAGKPIEMEARYRQADGTYRWFFTNNVPLRDEKGNIVKWYGTLQDIEDRKVAEAALRKSEEDWRNVFENNPTMYFMVDAAGTILAVNPFGAEQLGYQVDELTGRPMNSLFYEADREATQSVIARCFIQPGQSMSWEHRKVRKDGSVLWVRGTARAVPRGNAAILLIAGEDITDRKHAEEKIREQEMELRQILDAAPQHVAVLGPDGTRLYLNRAALDYHGFTLEQWQNLDPQSLFHPDDWERAHRGVENALSSGSRLEFEARVERRDGKFCWFLFRFNPLRDEQGHITRWAVAAIDIEDRKQAEERLRHENIALREEIDKASMFEEIVGASPALRAVLSRVAKVSPADSTVLLSGETGTGKELIARAIHKRSRRSSRAFVSVNCAAIPAALIGSELFGHEKGSFTGATHRRLGRFELAEGGTIFLDEVGELPVETQIALLRVLQEREFERVGGNQVIRTDVRVIAATNRDLEAAIAEGTFRRDLFYRLNVFPIEIPPLRERREDIPLLVEYFIDRYARKAGRNIRWVNKKSLDLLLSYSWPGNVRELQNVIERSVVVCETENFSVDESWLSPQSPVGEPKNALELSERLAAQEKEMIEAALRESGGRVFGPSGAASRLGMPRSTLESKIRALKIDKNRFKATRPAKGG